MHQDKPATECPTCKARVVYQGRADSPFFPFCSERCKLLDLGKWLEEEHRISEPLAEQPDQGDDEGQT